MMNYLWAGLIILALIFALWNDIADIASDKYANGRPLPAIIQIPPNAGGGDRYPITIQFTADDFARHFPPSRNQKPELNLLKTAGELSVANKLHDVRLTAEKLPAPLDEIRSFHDDAGKTLRARVWGLPTELQPSGDARQINVTLMFAPVRFVKLKAITKAAFEFANTAVTLAIGLIGVLALWLGLMKIAEASGLIAMFVSIVQPFLSLLFPSVPKDHPALGMIALNLAANMLGLGNAATPMGLKAMQELQKLNHSDDTATNPMVMLLALNTAGVQILPSATLVAVLGMSSVRLFIPILIVTGLCAVLAFVSTKVLERLPAFRRSNPDLLTPEGS